LKNSRSDISVLFNEPKLLKYAFRLCAPREGSVDFSALQRAEIAEMHLVCEQTCDCFDFSALQRAEIAEIAAVAAKRRPVAAISVLFNEPKLLKLYDRVHTTRQGI